MDQGYKHIIDGEHVMTEKDRKADKFFRILNGLNFLSGSMDRIHEPVTFARAHFNLDDKFRVAKLINEMDQDIAKLRKRLPERYSI